MNRSKKIIKLLEKSEWKSGLKVIHNGEVVHYTLYAHRNPHKEIENLKNELRSEEDFDMKNIINEVEISPMTPQEFREFLLHFESIVATTH